MRCVAVMLQLLHSLRARMTTNPSRSAGGEPLHPADLELVRRARAGDSAAVGSLLTRLDCVPAMLRGRHRALGSPFDADELAEVSQEIYAALWTKLATYAGHASIDSWAYRFVVLELFKALDRRTRRRRIQSREPESLELHPERELEELIVDPAILHDALERLGPPGADIVRQHHFEKLRFEDIAALTSEPVSTIKARYYRAMERLKDALQPHLRRLFS
jgi:RNA polymerase sigma factor (sigma-70 family)